MKTELLIGLLMNISSTATFFAGLFCLGVVVLGFCYICALYDNKENTLILKKSLKIAIFFFIVCLSLALIPTMDQLFKIRIGLIKLELTNRENVQLSIDEIGRVAHKLECKYLGCKENEKEKNNE